MDWSRIEAKWGEYRTRAKQRWDKLSQEQISNTRGNRAYLARRIQEAYALTANEAERQVADWQLHLTDVRAAANGYASSGKNA